MRIAGPGKGYKVTGFLAGAAALALLVAGCGGGGLSEEEVQSRVDAGITSALASVHELLQAQRIEVVDREGNVRVLLTTLEDGRPSISLLDDRGEIRAWLLLSSDGSPRFVLTDQPIFAMSDAAEEFRAVLTLDAGGFPSLSFVDQAGVSRSLLRLNADGTPRLSLFDENGEVIFTAPEASGQTP